MNTLARIASSLIAASIVLVPPLTAMADPKPAEHKSLDESASKPSSRHERAIFPMKAEEFRKLIERRLERIKAHVERSMTKHNLPAPTRAEVGHVVDLAAKDIHSAVDKAAADGTVSREEAKQVKELAEQLRETLRAQLKGKRARAKSAKAKAKAKAKTKEE